MSQRDSLAFLVCLTLAGCGNAHMGELKRYVQEVKQRQPPPIAPLPDIKPVDTFVYQPGDRRNPFVMDTQTAQAAAGTSNGIAPEIRRKEELEEYALDSLEMVGTLAQDNTMWGLIKAPGGTLYRVHVGNYMGTNNGQITRISDNEIDLTEIVSDKPGDWHERQASIALSQ